MNIAIIGDSVGLQSAGSLVSTWRFAEQLAKRGHRVILITTGEKREFRIENGIRVYYIPSKKTPFLEGSWRVPIFISKKKLKKIFQEEKIEVSHVVIPTPLCFQAIRVSRKLGLPVVSHFHTQPENLSISMRINSNFFSRGFYKFSGWFYGKTDVLICPSKFGQERISPYLKTLKSIVISNGIDLSKFKPGKRDRKFLKRLGIRSNQKIALFVGRLWPEKNISTLIKAMAHLRGKNISLIIVGKKEKEYGRLLRLVKDLDIHKKVFFLGRISSDDLTKVYNSSDVFCLPSLAELEGIVILEAMAHGKPLIVSNSQHSASRFFVEKNGYLYDSLNEIDLANKIKKICENDNLSNVMGSRSKKSVKKYSLDKSLDKLVNLYKSLLPTK